MFIAMEKLLCVVLLIATFRQAKATKWIPNEGPARYNVATLSNNGYVEYEVTTPERVTKTGKRLPVHKHFMKYSHSGKHSGTVYYKLNVFDRSFLFRLKQNTQFVSPSLTVEHVFSDTRRLPFAGDLLHCFYRGHVQGDPLSSAVFNLCNGLRGSFVSNGQRYFIEPTKDDKTNSTKYSRKYHIVYRHSSFEGNYRSNGTLTSTCGLEETNQPLPLARGKAPHPTKNNSTRSRRKKRGLDEAFVETMVTVDKTMVDAFASKADLQSYIITLMGVVAQVYHDKTIGNPINIVLVKIVMLETEEPGLHISSDAADTLRSFCRWQAKEMAQVKSHPEHHDTAILLTRRDICRRPGRCDTLGLAELGTMCIESRSCALAEDSGPSTAFTIAHELGHVFNLPHDGDNNICTRGSGKQHLMAPSLSFDTKPWSWSTCSRDKLTDFLDLGYGDCLSDKPHEKTRIKFLDSLPGELYSAEKQCQMLLGKKSSLCPFMEPCRRLWCVKKIGDRKGCYTHHMPWADGTPCSKNKWCIRGQCVKKRRLKAVDGNWGEWAAYAQCTRTCGGGVSFSFRKCNKPAPKNGGKYCIGSRKRFKSCNIQGCPKNSLDFRYIQCARRDGLSQTGRSSLNLKMRRWVPKYAGISKKNQCKLFCRQAGTAMYSQLSEKVIDGTPCNQETTDICVDGKCMPAGCDRVLYSDAKFDKCGVCKGDSSSCRRFSGTFNETNFGYNYIFTIPVGATDIVITQYGWNNVEDESFLALQRESGSYLLNGGMTIQLGVREFRAAGSKIWYSGSDKAIEQIKINGKTTERIKVLVLEVGVILPPNVHYALNEVVVGPQKFKWNQLGPWTQCSHLCQGIRKRRSRCVRAIDGFVVSNSRCDPASRPSSITEECNISCRLRWHIERLGNCSARCGSGYKKRTVRCRRFIRSQWDIVLDKHCADLRKPDEHVPCEGSCEGTRWKYSQWSKCSKSCDGGTQSRQSFCQDTFGEILKERDCRASDRQELTKQCNKHKCPWWSGGQWSSCSVTCGSGWQQRPVKCESDWGQVRDHACNPDKKPLTRKPCDLESCPYWRHGEWNECSVTCGTGTTTRDVQCLSGSLVRKRVSDESCSADTKPASRKDCKVQDCVTLYATVSDERTLNHYWRLSLWKPCSVTCGSKPGMQYRDVECVHVTSNTQIVVDEKHCEHTPRPTASKVCSVLPCASWKHGPWGRCSAPCGRGVQLRVVKCTYDVWTMTEDKNCDISQRPISKKVCQIKRCAPTREAPDANEVSSTARLRPSTMPTTTVSQEKPSWRADLWSECSKSCGEGRKQREVVCTFKNGKLSSKCNQRNKPVTRMACNLRSCPQWITGEWNECSVTCGDGIRTRSVRCDGGNTVCDPRSKPESTTKCNQGQCAKWRTGEWMKCSVTCGDGFKRRTVTCDPISAQCDARTKPEAIVRCNLRSCPKWTAGKWTECSVTCGNGFRRRTVKCDSTSAKCVSSMKPETIARCNLGSCPKWTTGEWTQCSVTCGHGFKRRTVSCNLKGRCDTRSKPDAIARCNIGSCPKWTTGDWSECPVTCGGGIKRRVVTCDSLKVQCDTRTKPEDTTRCNTEQCPQWVPGKWSECSVTCGSGFRQREVTCSSGNCPASTKPETSTVCSMGPCPEWTVGEWTACSVTCGNGFKRRLVTCDAVNSRCDAKTKPEAIARCSLGSCPEWTVGQWSECSTTCGDGFRRRDVKCSNTNARCLTSSKPEITASCNLGPCPTWQAGSWSQCSVTCGNGVKRRVVQCSQSEATCDARSKPVTTKSCILGTCPVWRTGRWSRCSKTCGNGAKTRAVWCSRSDVRCDSEKPVKKTECNEGACPVWKVGEWSKCSVTCGSGVRSRSVECSRSDVRCDFRRKPSTRSRCNLASCPVWRTGAWSRCSATCGNGLRRRTVQCSRSDVTCDASLKPSDSVNCNLGSCPEWRALGWSQCSVTCGDGFKRRIVQCSRRGGCDPKTRPESTARCNLASCPQWKPGPWTRCSVTCGNGFKRRLVRCSHGSDCDVGSKPEATADCNLGSCPKWKAGPWSQCSATCGGAFKERIVECDGLQGDCDVRFKPTMKMACNLGECPRWKIGEWAECSVTCGNGFKKRKIECVTGINVTCDERTKPVVTAKCNRGLCPRWNTGRWTECSRTCGEGVKRRAVACLALNNGSRLPESACDVNKKPSVKEVCNVMDCVPGAEWYKGDWGKCSVYCGIGDKYRDIWCAAPNRTRIADLYCSGERKPRATRSCNKRQRCGVWEFGLWDKCSQTCGKGFKTRAIRCLHQLEYKGEMYCDSKTRPLDKEQCSVKACPSFLNIYHWQTSVWSKCSKKCGYGRKSRGVWCVDISRRNVSNKLCSPSKKPTQYEACFNVKCPAKWNHGYWTECSRSCGRGYQYRAVECVARHGRLQASACDRRTKPPVWRSCNLGHCNGYMFWRVGPWSQCSVTCGVGVMRRAVKCLARNSTIVADSLCETPSLTKPDSLRSCLMKDCEPKSCKEVQTITGVQTDGEQTLMIQGKQLKVYCFAMMSDEPKEYITVKTSAENFAEIYPKVLRDPKKCPANGTHIQDCNCEDKDYKNAGASYFSKLRIDLTAMKIIADDKQFASTRGLNPPPYGTAGDCYSAHGKCPQGRFSINLHETGIRLTSKVMWGSTGRAYSQIIYRYPEGLQVIGKCGGFCGICSPDVSVGLQIELNEGDS